MTFDLIFVLSVLSKIVGPNHVDVALSYNNIGLVYSKKGDLYQALDYYQRALEIKEKQLGPNHVDVAVVIPPLWRRK